MLKHFKRTLPNMLFIKTFLKMATPLVMSEMLMVAVGFVDNFMIGGYGDSTHSLASIMIGNELLFVGMGIPMFFMTMFSIYIAQFHGSGDDERKRETIKFWIMTALITSVIFCIILASATRPLVKLYESNDAITIQGAVDYVRYATPSVFMMCFGYAGMTAASITGRPFWSIGLGVGSVLINVIGDYLLIYTADMGIIGSAIATDISRVFEVCLTFFVLTRYRDINIFIHFKHFDWGLYKKEMKKISSALSQVAFTISLVVLSLVLSRKYGVVGQSALSIIYAMAGILWSIFPGVGVGVKTFVGANLGKGEFDTAGENVSKVAWSSAFIMIPLVLIVTTLAFTIPDVIMKKPTTGGIDLQNYNDAIPLAKWGTFIFALSMPLYAYTSVFFGVLQAGGHIRASNIVQNYFQLVVIIPLAALCAWGFNASFLVTLIVTQGIQFVPLVISVFLVKKNKWKNNLTLEHK